MVRIALINPPIRPKDPPSNPPYGLAVLGSLADQEGYEVVILDVNAFRLHHEVVRAELRGEAPLDVIGVSGFIPSYRYIKFLLPFLKKDHPDTLFVAGGGAMTSLQEDMMRWVPEIDIGCIGEGEKTFMELLKHTGDRDFSGVKGVLYREDGEIVRTPPRPLMTEEELNELPYPKFDLLPLEEVYWKFSAVAFSPEALVSKRRLPLLSSRGCPFVCKFCLELMTGESRTNYSFEQGPKIRFHSADYVVGMIKWMRLRYATDFVNFLDECFTADKERATEICHRLEDEGLSDVVKWGATAHPSHVDPELLKTLKDGGATYLDLGFESADDRILKEVRKGTTVERNRQVLRWCLEAHIQPITNFICIPKGESIFLNEAPKNIESASKEDLCLNMRGEFQEILETYERPYHGVIYEIKAHGIPPMKVTDEHPILISKRKTKYEKRLAVLYPDKPAWTLPSEIQKGDYLIIPKIKEKRTPVIHFKNYRDSKASWSKVPDEIILNDDLAYLFGVYLAEGSSYISPRKACSYISPKRTVLGTTCGLVHFYLGAHEKELISNIERIIKEQFNLRTYQYLKNKNKSCNDIIVASQILVRFFKEQFGNTADTKKIPNFIINSRDDLIKSFLRGYLAGDGCVYEPRKKIIWCTTSKTVAQQLYMLLVKVGMLPHLCENKREGKTIIEGKSTNQKNRYTIYVHGDVVSKLLDVNWRDSKRFEREDENYFYVPITKITKAEYSGLVFNLKTKDGTFTAPFAITHNCGFPTMDLQSVYNDAKFWRDNGIMVHPFWLGVYPKTEYFEEYKERILEQFDGDYEKFVLACEKDTDSILCNITSLDTPTLIGLREMAINHDLEGIRKYAELKGVKLDE